MSVLTLSGTPLMLRKSRNKQILAIAMPRKPPPRRTAMAHPTFEQVEELEVCVRAHTPAVDAAFAWNEDESE
ncbi:hypothetical protein Aph01nite_10190 [Acrocarpospora phusangensis]|uniref:Uncharacterized protein n=1 Tax=Acrocarpospora phusangensis TaxID=1070424 RepID=A0A919Q5F3_9ACTN|nr:hypothetical protein Aph01nite_10190 [Acrocarpospora phusangensis]